MIVRLLYYRILLAYIIFISAQGALRLSELAGMVWFYKKNVPFWRASLLNSLKFEGLHVAC